MNCPFLNTHRHRDSPFPQHQPPWNWISCAQVVESQKEIAVQMWYLLRVRYLSVFFIAWWRGVRGEKGEIGVRGEKGERGERGERGVRGVRGERGVRGVRGEGQHGGNCCHRCNLSFTYQELFYSFLHIVWISGTCIFSFLYENLLDREFPHYLSLPPEN